MSKCLNRQHQKVNWPEPLPALTTRELTFVEKPDHSPISPGNKLVLEATPEGVFGNTTGLPPATDYRSNDPNHSRFAFADHSPLL